MKVRKKDRKQFPRIFSPMSLDTSFCSYNAFHWTRNSYTSANDVTDKKLRARSIDRIPQPRRKREDPGNEVAYSGIGLHGIQVRNPSFLRRFTLKMSNAC